MDQKQRIRRSSLWAAYGDAIGFITELAGTAILKKRTGLARIDNLLAWTRRLGGQFGADIDLPIGCYSDDTQLRLATCRAIRGNGEFDVEAFANVELPVWNAYSLGGGFATKTGAEALSKAGTRWFSNFYNTKRAAYLKSGGNGAAMRIQPHVWSAPNDADPSSVLKDVIRNSVVTHGHPRAIAGAAFHALCLNRSLKTGSAPTARDWEEIVEDVSKVPSMIQEDRDLPMFWLPLWEREARCSIESAFQVTVAELREDIAVARDVERAAIGDSTDSYLDLVEKLGCFKRENLGSGTKTTILASFLAAKFAADPQAGMSVAANALGSDTDTIASMAGAIVGCTVAFDPPQDVMDKAYLERESERLAVIAAGSIGPTFRYPDLLYWKAPKRHLDYVGTRQGRWFVAGLGEANPIGKPKEEKDRETIWRWFELQFGQHILLRHRQKPENMSSESLPLFSDNADSSRYADRDRKRPPSKKDGIGVTPRAPVSNGGYHTGPASINQAADDVIRSNFDPKIIGSWLLRIADEKDGVDKAIAFSAIVSKARNARSRKTGSE